MRIPKYFYFRVRVINKGTGVEIEDASDADVEEVVRCKDCKWYENDGYHTHCRIMRFSVEAEDYCSSGERREDGKID